MRLKPDFVVPYSNLGATLSDLGQNRESIAILNKGLELSPSDSRTHYNIAIAYQRLSDLNSAAHYFQQAITFNPNLALAYGNLGL